MVLSSGIIMSNTLSIKLDRHANEMMDKMAYVISDSLSDPKTPLTFFSVLAQDLLQRGDSHDEIKRVAKEITSDEFKKSFNSTYNSAYIYFEETDELFSGDGWVPPDDFQARERPWYKVAVEAQGEIGITKPFACLAIEGRIVVAYSRQIFDVDGSPLGVVFIDFPLDELSGLVVSQRITDGGYGILIDKDLRIIIHPNEPFIGENMSEIPNDLAKFTSDVEGGNNISLQRIKNYFGVGSFMFGRQIENDWYLCVIIPEHEYYSELYDMIIIISSMAVFFASVLIAILSHLEKKRKQEKFYTQMMLDSSPICCQLWDRNLNTIDCNEAAVKLYGFNSKDEYVSRFIHECSPEHQPNGRLSSEMAVELVNGAFENGYWCGDWIHQIPFDKSLMPAEVTLVRVPYKKDYIVAGYTRDLREHNEMMEDIRNSSEKLETALELAEAGSKAKGEFLSTMSHEIRTPLNAIIGMTAIGSKADDVAQKDYALDKIDEASKHLLGLINDVLDMAKIEANKLELSSVEFDFEKMVRDVIAVVDFKVKEKKQSLTVNVSSDIPRFIMGDDQRLSQVIANLLSNAVKFTNEGGEISVDASLFKEAGDICELKIEVADSGIGISVRQQEKIFRAFEQAENEISREYGGTGLGLAISRRIVELMGGKIWIDSEIGKGTKFIFTIKTLRGSERKPVMLDEGVEGGTGEESVSESDGVFKGKRLLLAEDVEINREIFSAILEGTGLEIDYAENGQEAFDTVLNNKERYDAIFMDVQMPGMDGYEATRRIRQLGITLPIIALTANVFKDDIAACLVAGMDDHLGKPLDIDKIFEKLREYLNN
jgi:signal transduction histidine kinase